MEVGETAVIDRAGLDAIVAALRSRGLRTLGPVVRDGAIVHGEVAGTADLPVGWHDRQEPGRYRLEQDGGTELFGWAVGPASWKAAFFAAEETLWRAELGDGELTVSEPGRRPQPVALIGARPCELRALEVLDRVLQGGAVPDDRYAARRRGAFVLAAECGSPSGTCFCASLGTGPALRQGVDLTIIELLEGGQRFFVRVESPEGAAVLATAPHRRAEPADARARDDVLARAGAQMGRTLETEDLPALLARNLEHPRWDEVAERCLSCGNCTLVCPTCFCSDVKDVSDVAGVVARERRWASCFDPEHSYLHGGPVRATISARYRQWLTHKLSTWWDQFGESGCVGCGRCITWCPVGIDLTEEAAAIRASDCATRPQARP